MYQTRRNFIRSVVSFAGAGMLQGLPLASVLAQPKNGVQLCAHLWVYASKFSPDWDATPVLETAFAEVSAAGFEGIELMEVNLRHDDAVRRLSGLSRKYKLPVTGISYQAYMWDRERQDAILQDVVLVTGRLQQLGGKTLGISVGDAGRKKTDGELDIQATTLQEILNICAGRNILPNLHNHTYELRDGMHDLLGTLDRVPELKLGPDLNWLQRGGVDPVWFIRTYGHRMVYLHLRDQHKDGKWSEALREGVADFKAIAKALREVNFSGMAAVELAYDKPPINATAENWKKSREFVRKVFGW